MKTTMNRLIALFALTVMVFTLFTVSAGATEPVKDDVIVLYTNDVHCAHESYPLLAAYRAQLMEEGYKVVTVDAGDALQGEIIGALTEGSAIIDIMNNVGYDYAIPGNHEFDYTTETFLTKAETEADYQYLCANFRYIPEDKTVFAPYALVEANGKKLAFVGISTPETYSKSTPTYFQDENGNFIYSFSEDDFYNTIQTAVDNAIAEGAETVVAIGHLGISDITEGWRSVDVIANTHGIDAFIDGHAHETIETASYTDKNGNTVTLSSTGTKLGYFGQMTVSANGNITTKLIDPDSIDVTALSDSANVAYNNVFAVVDGYNKEFDYLFEELGSSDAFLTQNDANGNRIIRFAETNLGNFVTDAYLAVIGGDVAFTNGGGIRSEITQGAVTRKALMDINPWNNEMCVIEVTGKQLLDALEYGVSAMPAEFGSFPHVAGISFEVHTYIDTPVITNELGDFVAITEGAERRVKNVKVGDTALDPDKTYTLSGSCYMLQLSGYKMFDGAKVVKKEGLPTDTEVIVEYFTKHLNGKISADQYGNANGEGRMKTVTAPAEDNSTPSTNDSYNHVIWYAGLLITAMLSAVCTKTKKYS